MVQFADINLIASELAICLFTGRYERIGSNMRWLPKRFSIIVSVVTPSIRLLQLLFYFQPKITDSFTLIV